MKRLLTLALSLGFFIWLPSAFADGDGLSLNAPATFRQVQVLPEGGSSLLTLNVNNIQVRAAWDVSEPNSVFTISAGGSPNEGVLKATAEATGPHVVTVYAVDQFELLNPAYVNLTASAVITVVFESGNKFGFVDVPLLRLSVIEGSGDSLYTFVVTNGVAPYIYGVDGAESGYFSIDPPDSGDLSIGAATVGIYTLSVTVDDSETPSNSYTAQVIVDVRPPLLLSQVSLLTAFAGKNEAVHTFAASGGIGEEYTYKILGNYNSSYFLLIPSTGEFNVYSGVAAGTYMLTMEVNDVRNNKAQATVTLKVLPGVALTDVQIPSAVAHGVEVHTFEASGGLAPYTYKLVDGGGSENFDLKDGALSTKQDAIAGTYTLTVAVEDTRDNKATAQIIVQIAGLLALHTPPLVALAGLQAKVHTFSSSGGVGAKRYTLLITDDSGNFSVDAESGELVLAGDENLEAGQYILSLEVSDLYERITAAVTVRAARNAIFVLGGLSDGTNAYERDVWWSVDGNSWLVATNTAAWTGRYEHQAAGYGARLYVSGGEDNNGIKTELMYSVNGKDWLDDGVIGGVGWQARTQHQVVEHQGNLYILGGKRGSIGGNNYTDDVWSTDGNSWQQRTSSAGWTAKQGYQVVSHQGRLYKLGGANGNTRTSNVWSSADGTTWIFEGEADWSGRDNHQAVSHQGRIYVLGGYDGRNRLSDVWSSADGRSWTPEGNADWPSRDSYQAVSYNGMLYVLGGNDGSRKNDVWSLADGNSWNLVQGGAGWSARDGLQAVVFPPPLVILGASEKINLVAGTGADLYTFSARYGFGNYAYSLADGTDADFKINNGVLSMDGDLDAGLYTVIVWVTDEEGTRAQTAIIIELFNFTLADVPMKLVAYAGSSEEVELYTLAAVYGVEPYTYNLVNESQLGTFTVGATSGILSVLPSASVGVYTVPVEVEDGDGNSATAVATVELSENLSLADAQRLSVVAGKALILHTFSADGGAGTPTYDLLNHKDYFTVDGDSGILSVQAVSEVGVYTLSVEASDGEGSQATARAIVDVLPRLSLADASLLIAVEKKAVSLHMFSANGGIGGKTYTFVAVADDDTKYFSLNITSGVLSLQATANAGKYTLTVEVKDERDNRDKAVATVNISTALSLADAGLLRAAVSVRNDDLHTFAASGGLGAKTYILAAVAANFMVDPASGVLSVDEQTTLTTYIVSVQVTDASGDTAVAVATVEMVDLLLESALNLSAIVGRNVSLHTFEAVGGVEPNTYTIVSGDGKEYFTLGAANGVLSVQVSATVGIYTLSVKVEDDGDNEAEALAVVVVASSLSLAGVSYEDAVPAFSSVTVSVYTFITSGGIGAKTYILVRVDGNGNFAVDAANGVLSVVNAQAGRSEVVVKVSDSRGNTAEAVIGVEVKDRLLLTEVPLLENFARLSVTVILHTLVDSGGEAPKRYTMIADKSGYFIVGADNGELSLPPNPVMPAGTYTLLVEVSDAGSPIQRATATVTVQLASNGIFVLGGQSGSTTNENDVWSSVDGEAWKEQADADWDQRRYHQAVAHNGRLYVLGGRDNDNNRKNDVWYSVDGENWTLVTDTADWDAREKHQAVAHNGRIYVLGGFDGSSRLSDVWSSADGKSWDQVTGAADWSIREDHQAVVHNGRIYVLGGFDGGDVYNDVWSSADGNTWRFEGNAAWGARYIHQAVSHSGRLYVLGGSVLGDYNDVWSSVDGRSWVQEQANNSDFWSERSGHQSLSRDGLLYVLGGFNDSSNTFYKDVWSSADGVEWDTPTEADWTGRQRHQAVVFPSPLALVGTSETITLTARVDAGAIHTFIAQHGLGDPAYSLAPEGLGFSIGDNGVLLANNISQTGLYVLTVRVEDKEGAKAESVVNLEVLSFALADAPPISFLAGLSTEKELHTFVPVYGVEEYTYNLSGDGAEHFTLGNNGVLSANARVVTVGIYILSAKVTDGNGNQATAVARVEAVPQVSLDDALPLSLVAAKVTVLHTFKAKDGIGTHTYNLLNERGSFTVVADSGVLSSRATTAAKTYVLMVEVRDGEGGGSQATALVTVEVRPRLVLTDTERLIAVERKAKDLHTFTSIGGIGAATYTLTTGNGAEYFALNATSGVLSLSAEAIAGQYMLTVGVKDERANSDEKIVAVNISAALSLLLSDDAKPISNRENQAQDNLYTFEASGGIGIKTYTLVVDVAHFKVNAAGVLAVDADASAGDYTLSVEVSDADDNRASVVATVQLVALYLSDIDSLYAIVGRNVSLHTFDGGDAAQNYVITDGNVGSHFTLSAQSGVLAVQNTAPVAIYTLSVVVEDGSGNSSEAAKAVVEVRLSLLLADAPRLTAVAEFAASLHTFVAAHGGDGKAYTIEGGDTDGNFVLNAASGALSLRAESAAGLYTLTVQAADERESLVTAVATVEVSAALRLTDALLLVADAGDVVSLTTFTASGGIGVKTYTLVAGNEDKYFAINATSGVLSVVSAEAMPKIYTLSVRAIDRQGYRVEARGLVSVRAVLALNMPAAPLRALTRLSVTVILHQFTASNGIGTKQYAIADDEGYFAIDEDSGVLSLPANSTMVAGDYILNLEVSDSDVPPQRVTSAVEVRIIPNGLFVLGGNDAARKNDVWSLIESGDWGQDTAAADWPARDGHQAVPYKGRLYVLGGNSGSRRNDVWSSADGSSWQVETAANWPARDGHQAVAHNGRIYVLGGNDGTVKNDVWWWDGGSWQQETAADWPARDGHQAVAHNGRIYVLGGNDDNSNSFYNDVWSSADGSSWEQETAAAGWTVRVGHQAVAHKGRIYVLGGKDEDGTVLNDVWSSFDGENWSEETAAAQWDERAYHMARSYRGRLYISSGQGSGDTTLKDIWSSADGKTWQPETSADWAERYSHQMAVFPQPLILTNVIDQVVLTFKEPQGIHTFAAQHGFGSYTYSFMPPVFGIVINNEGFLSASGGTQPGIHKTNVRVHDQDGAVAETPIKIEVISFYLADAPRLSVLADSATAVSVHTFAGVYGVGDPTYILEIGAGSDNFTLGEENGVLSVNASVAAGVYTLTIGADDTSSQVKAVATVVVVPRVAFGDIPRLSVVAAKALVLHTLTAMDGLGTYTYNLLNKQEYFTVVATSGVLSSRSTVVVGGYALQVEVRDGAGSQATAQVMVNVRARLAVVNAPLLVGTENRAKTLHEFVSSGGIGVATYTLFAGNADYFFMGTAGDLILLTAAVKGRYTVTVRATDERDNTADAVATVNISAALLLADAPLISAAVRTAADLHMFEASGGVGVKTYDLEAGASYFSVISTSGLLAVNDQAPADVYSLTVKATDTDGNEVLAVATVVVSRLFLADAEIYGIANTQADVYIFDGGADAETYSIVFGKENYFVLNPQSGVFSVQLAPLGIYILSIAAYNAAGDGVLAKAVVEITMAVSLANAPPLTVVADAAVSLHTFAASHGFGSKIYAFAAGNGAGHFDLNALSGVLSLRADAVADVYTLSVRATDEYGNWGEAVAVVDVSAALQMAETPPLTVSVAIGEDKIVTTYVATGGLGAKTYMVVALENFTINGETGALSVVNAPQTGFYTLSVQAVDQRGITVEVQSTVHVKGELLLANATTRLDTFARLSVEAALHTFSAIGGLGAKSYDFKDESGYFHHKVVGDNIILSLPVNSAMLEGTYTVSLVVSDSDMPPQQRTATAEILIAKNGLVILGGASSASNRLNDVWLSADGHTWAVSAAADWSARSEHQAVAHNGRLYVMGGDAGGDKNDVWSSADGRTWTLETAAADWTARSGHQAVAHQGQIYVLGGNNKNDVWSSADGKNWVEMTAAAGWTGRSEHQAVSHNSRLYVLGGLSGSTPLRDVWSSADGRTWSRDTETAGWVARNEHQVVSHQGRLYVLGGWRGGSPFKDVWSSADGKDWVLEPAADWAERYGHQVQSYRGSLYLSLGQAGGDAPINNTWSSADGSDWQQGTVGGWSGGRFSHQMEVFPPAMVLFGISQPVVLNLGASSPELHTYSARYGGGAYTYTLVSDSNAFDLENRVLKSNSNLAEGNYTLTVIVTDAEGSMDQNVVKIQAQNNFAVVDVPPLYAEANVAAAVSLHTFAAVQGTAPITFTIFSGNEGEHFTLNAESSVLSVQNASVGIYTLGVRAEDSRSPTRRRVEVFVVVNVNYPLALADANVTIQTGITAGFYTLSITGGGGVRTLVNLARLDGSLEYFSINVANGVVQVSNAAVGRHAFVVQITDESTSGFAQANIVVQVVPQMSLVAVPSLAAVARLSVNVTVHTFSVTAGVGNIRYTLIADESGYLTLNADSGVLLLPENPDMLAGTYSLQVLVSDSLPVPQLATAVATLRILKNGIFMMGGVDTDGNELDDVWAAADGRIWAKMANADWPVRSNHQAVVYQGRMYVLGGYDGSDLLNDMWSSVDGKNWTPEDNPAPTWDARIRFQAVSHNGRLYVLGGGTGSSGNTLKNDVWSWAEGESWMAVTVSAAWLPRRAHQAVSHNGRLYVMGGGSLNDAITRDDVWSSVDGANWSFEGFAAWPARIQHQAVSHNGRIYVLGGSDSSSRNDVWSWAEGESWTREAANNNAFWSERILFKALSHDGLLYVMGGDARENNANVRKNDVWSSADGVSWTEVTGSADWIARRTFQAVVFPPNLELPGASETIILTLEAGLEIYTFRAQYGGGQYKYSLPLDPEGFNIDGDGVLSANDEEVPAGIYLVTVRVNDEDGSQAESVINIELRSFALADAPALTAATALPATVKVHTFSAIYGVGEYTYAIASGNVGDYFSLGENSGELAVVNAAVGIYTLFVAVEDEVGSSAEAVATVVVKEFLALADVPLLGALAASTMSIYTFIPANLQGDATYTLVAGNAAYFSVNPSSGVLSVANAAAGFYTVTVEVSDGTDQAQVPGVVQVVLPVTLADLMLETPKATMGAMLTVHTFIPIDGFGAKRYAIVDGNQGYFAVGGGDLLLVGNDAMLAGHYTLSVEVTDSLVPPRQATAMVVVNILRSATAAQIMLMGGEDDSSQRLNDVWTSANGEIWESQPNEYWTKRTEFQAVFHNGRVYVMGGVDADGSKQDVWSTADGSSWDYEGEAAWTMRRAFVAVSHKGRIYVMGGNSADGVANDVWSSADGRSWVPEGNADWDARYLFDGMSHNGRIYVLGGYDGTRRRDVWWSEDGQTWNEATSDAGWGRNSFSAASHNGRMYMTGGNSGSFHNDVWSSEDGTTWVLEKANDSTIGWDTRDNHQVFSFDGLLYVVGGRLNSSNDKANDIWSSADGKSWTEVTDEAAWPARNVFDVAVGEGTFLAIIADRVVSFSPNYNGEIYQVSARFGFGKYTYSLEGTVGFTIDQNGRLSADGSHDAGRYTVTVRVEDAERLQAETQIILDSDLLSLADASPQHIFTRLQSTVVLHTFAATGGGKPYTYNLAPGNGAGYFTLDEKSGVLTFPANESATAGDYVLVVEVRDNLSGQANARITVQLDGGRKMFVLGGSDGTVYLDDVWSYNGAWTEETASAEWDPVGYAQTVPHKGLLYKIGGRAGSNSTSNSVWSSKDAKNWTRAGSAGSVGRVDSQAASLNGRLYVAGGASTSTNYRRDVFSSEDGKSWVQETANANWPGREGHQMVAFNGRLYVMGGQTDASTFRNDVWSSSNGKNWEFEGNADWSARAKHQAVVHEGRIYVMGGSNGSALDDVWSSEDGKNWEREKENAKWTARQDFAAVSFDISGNNFIWIMGGSDGSTNLDDAWASTNGEGWVKPPVQPKWSARVGFDAVVFPPRLALYGLRGTIQLAQSAKTTVIHTFTAEYGLGALNYSLEPGHNANFSMDSNGVLTANENLAIGSYTLTAKVVDSESTEAKAEIRIRKNTFKVADAPPRLAYSKLAAEQGLHTFRPSGGTAPYTYRIFTQGPFVIGENNGVLALPAGDTKAGSYPLLVRVRDSGGLNVYPRATVNVVKNRMIVMSGNAFPRVGDSWESEDGVSWRTGQSWGFGDRWFFTAASHRGRVYAMGGGNPSSSNTPPTNSVYHSATGNGGWSSYGAPWPARSDYDAASNGDTMYLMGGNGNKSDVWSTMNGNAWTLLSNGALPGRSGHQVVWHNGRLYVLGGNASGRKNDVWSSADGISWRDEGDADWSARERHQAFSHKGWIYVMGGLNVGNGRLNDVWRSLDGRSWEQVKATGAAGGGYWVERHSYQAFSLDGRLYLMGGTTNNDTVTSGSARLKDVWSSEDDGVTWTLLSTNTWEVSTGNGRQGFGALAFPPNLVVHGPSSDVITVSVGVTPDIMFTARDGYTAEPYTYALKPKMAGFNIDSDGVLSVDEDAEGGFHRMTVLVTDGEGTQAETIVRVDVHALQIVDVPQLTAVVRLPVAVSLHTFTGAFGQGTYTYNLVGGNVAGYFDLDAGGDLSLLQNDQMRGGSFDLLVEVSDSVPRQATAVVQVRLLPGQVYVLGGYDGTKQLNDVWSSFDNKTWKREVANANWPARQDSQVVVYKGRLYVLGGHDGSNSLNDVWSSADGKNWSFEGTADWPARGEHQAVVYKGRLYVLGGYEGSNHPYLNDFTGSRLNDVWSSADGKSWSFEGNADWSARSGHATAVHNDVLYVLGGQPGFLNDEVWSSVDGQNWSFEGDANWFFRRWFQAQSFNSRLYVLGGDAGGGRGDIWSSADGSSLGGKSWLEVRGSGSGVGWSDRGGHQALLYQDLMYVLGGSSFSNELNDVWSSGDGSNWTKVADAGWSKRDSHQAVTFPPSLALAGTNEHFILSVGVAESAIATVTAQHGFGDYTYSLAPGTGKGFTFDSNTRVLSNDGSSIRGSYWVTVQVTDEDGALAETVIRVDVHGLFLAAPPPILIYGGIDLGGTNWPAQDLHTFVAAEGVEPYTYALKEIATQDINFFTIEATSGVLAAKEAIPAPRTYNIGVEVTDGDGTKVQVNVKVVASPVLSLTDAPTVNLFIDEIAPTVTLHTFAAGGGIGAKVYNIVSVNADGHFSLDRNSGVLSAVSLTVGAYTLAVRVSDSRGSNVGAQAVVRILEPFLSAVPPLVFLPPKSMSVTLYNFTGGSIGKKVHIFLGGDRNYFNLGEESGILSAKPNTPAGTYVLRIGIVDTGAGGADPQQVIVTVYLVDNGIFVLGGNDGALRNDVWLASEGGVVWGAKTTDAGWPGRTFSQAVLHNERIYVLGGEGTDTNGNKVRYNDVWSSADEGITWEFHGNANWPGRSEHQAVSHNGGLYVLGGTNGSTPLKDVWSSTDGGATWQPKATPPWSIRRLHQAVSHNGRIYITGGHHHTSYRNDMWSSADGANWTRESAGEWLKRKGAAAVSHNGRIYLMGGSDGKNRLNDVWSSADGISWRRETGATGATGAEWSIREVHQAVSRNGLLYVMGGTSGGNEVWSSADGKSWTIVTGNANWTARIGHQAVVLPRSFSLLGAPGRVALTANVAASNIHTFQGQNGTPAYTYSFLGSAPGFGIGRSSGVLSVDDRLVTSVVYAVTVQVQDADGRRTQAEANIEALAPLPLVLLPGTDEILTVTSRIVRNIHTFRASQGSAGYAYLLKPLITGFAIGSNGVLSTDNNLAAGIYTVIVQVSDKKGATPAQTSITVDVRGFKLLGFGTKIWGQGNEDPIHAFQTEYGVAPYSYSLHGGDSNWFQLKKSNKTSNILHLKFGSTPLPPAKVYKNIIVRVQDGRGLTSEVTVRVDVRAVALPAFSDVPLDGGRYYSDIANKDIKAQYGAPPYTYTLSPPVTGYSIDPISGALEATGEGALGTYTITVKVTDSKGKPATRGLVVRVRAPSASAARLISFPNNSIISPSALSHPPRVRHGDLAPPPQVRGVRIIHHLPPREFAMATSHPPTSAGDENYPSSHPPL